MHLIVHNPFGGYVKGALITDSEAVEEILAGAHASHVLKVNEAALVERVAPVAPAGEE